MTERQIKALEEWIGAKGTFKVNVGKTKIMCSANDGLKAIIKSIKFPCSVCGKGVGANSIQCTSCTKWVHKRCSEV